MDIHYCRGNSPRAIFHLAILDLTLIISSVLIYAINTWIIKPSTGPGFYHYYFNDIFAAIMALAISNIIIGTLTKRFNTFTYFPFVFAFVVYASFFWEYITPLYKQSTTDLLDFLAYGAGGLIYWIITIIHSIFMKYICYSKLLDVRVQTITPANCFNKA